MDSITRTWAAEAMGARLVGASAGCLDEVVTDSRRARPGALFFALQGDKADGHIYVPGALAAGAAAVVASEVGCPDLNSLFVVDSPLAALGRLAAAYRNRFTLPVVGITGSVGKTSTKEMAAHALRSRYRVSANEKNFNNEIGVPLTLFNLNSMHDIAIVEMGMRAAGEIRYVASMARPSIAAITNIGRAHEEILGSQEAIAAAKAELLETLPSGGVAILPAELPYEKLVMSRLPAGCRVVRVGDSSSDFWAEALPGPKPGSHFKVFWQSGGEPAEVSMCVPGAHHMSNALLAIAIASELGIPVCTACDALSSWSGAEGRMTQRRGLRGIIVLDDCYNAGPESMQSALVTLGAFPGSRTAVLGDMRELGADSAELHRAVGKLAAGTNLRALITVGELAALLADEVPAGKSGSPEIVKFQTSQECADCIDDLINPGETVLVKGSRAMQMERIVSQLTGEVRGAAHG